MRYAAHAAPIALRSLRATSFDGDYLAQVQHRRLGTVVRHARRSSPFFRHHMRDLPDELPDITAIAPTRKRDLMAAFDDWVTDPRLRLDRITDEFLSRPELVGQKYLGRYRVFTTSGTTGHPAVVIHDPSSWLVLQLVSRLRSWPVLSSHGLTIVLFILFDTTMPSRTLRALRRASSVVADVVVVSVMTYSLPC